MFFRNYRGKHVPEDVTIIQAIRATWATPKVFSSVLVGPPLRAQEVVSAVNGFNNPIMEAIKEAKDIFGPETKTSCVLSLGSGKWGLDVSLTEDINYGRYSDKWVKDTEKTAEQAQKWFGHTGVYFRLAADLKSEEDAERVHEDRLFGAIDARTDAYLRSWSVNRVIDACIDAAGKSDGILLEHLVQAPSNRGKPSVHGLPPLSKFFVLRDGPTKKISNWINGHMNEGGHEPRVCVLSGLGGSGKTQLAIKFALDNTNQFKHILFIDASSAETIERGLLACLRNIDTGFKGTTKDDAMNALSYPKGEMTTNWLIIFDNADDPDLKLSGYFPNCGHGVILITSRNRALGNISPGMHLPLDVMSPAEAVEALLSSALDHKELPTHAHRQHAAEIVEKLGYLPLAVTQAGCYIKMQRCFDTYLERLGKSRMKMFRHHSQQSDKLRYDHSVYAAFETTFQVITERARNFLRILSFFHYNDIPKQLFSIAASYQFKYQPFDLLERSQEFEHSVALLRTTFCPSEEWDETDMDDLLEELQKYSLVTIDSGQRIISGQRVITLSFHPLLSSFVGDSLKETNIDYTACRAAAGRLLACGTNDKEGSLWSYLTPHMEAVTPVYNELHLNEQAALASIVRHDEKNDRLVQIWKHIHRQVVEKYGERHLKTTDAALQLADAYGSQGDVQRMERMERAVVNTRIGICGRESLETAAAMINLARTLISSTNKCEEGENLIRETLRIERGVKEPNLSDIADGLLELGKVQMKRGQLEGAEVALLEAVELREKQLDRTHYRTLEAMQVLAECQGLQNKLAAIATHKDVFEIREKIYGPDHHLTLHSMTWLAKVYYDQERYADAESMRRRETDIRARVFGLDDPSTLGASFWLGRALLAQLRYADAEEVFRQNLKSRQQGSDVDKEDYLITLSWLAEAVYEQGRYYDATQLREEETRGCTEVHGPNHPATLSALSAFARCIHEQKRYAEAEMLRKREMDGWLAFHGGKWHPSLLICAFWYGRALFDQEKVEDAKKIWLDCSDGWKQLQSEPTRESLEVQSWLARVAYEQSGFADSAAIWEKVVEGKRKLSGAGSRETLVALRWLARCLFDQRKYKESEEVRRKEVEGWKALQGISRETLDAISWLARTVYQQGNNDEEAERLWREAIQGWDFLCPQQIQIGKCDALFCLGQLLHEQRKFVEAEVVWRANVESRTILQGVDHPDTKLARDRLSEVFSEIKAQTRRKITPARRSQATGPLR
ncbi:hypothetical protein FRC17_007430 [Serendipita sp. 399]|nr:hypothetical protein FRC17_007430 [Serendipita sp. 399]